MQINGKGEIIFTSAEDELPHAPTADINWQESVVLYFWDHQSHCYGFLRLGHQPNQRVATVWSNLWVDGYQYKYTDDPAIDDSDRKQDGFSAGEKISYRYDGSHHWSVNDNGLSAEFSMTDSHSPFDFFAGSNLDKISPKHIESSGIVNGTIVLNGKNYLIKNAIGYRDRSWGLRVWESLRTHRWTPAIFSDNFSVNAMAYMGPTGPVAQFGYIVRDDTLHVPSQVSICTHVEADSQTTRGGSVALSFDSGEVLTIDFRPLVPSAVSYYRGYPCNDLLCIATCNGQEGVGVFESGGNSTGGREKPRQEHLISGNIDNGFFRY